MRVETACTVVRVGSAPDNTIALGADDTVSRHHCVLVPTAQGIAVHDSGSRNGSYVDGARVVNVTFPRSFALRVGATSLSVSLSNEAGEALGDATSFGALLGTSARMRQLFVDLRRIAASDVNVLIEGETGTGKELVAEALHEASARALKPYVIFDCAAVAPPRADVELFGDGGSGQPGALEQAHGGTLFLDELSELPRAVQAKLAHTLQSARSERVGSSAPVTLDVRVVAATNRDLRELVERHLFSRELFSRIAAEHVLVPPLRERLDDLPLLVGHLLRGAASGASPRELPSHVWQELRDYDWPGNVRELQNVVRRSLVTPERGVDGRVRPSAARSG